MECGGEGPIRLGRVTSRKRTAREPPFSCRKESDDVKNLVCLTDGAASGIQVGAEPGRGGGTKRGNLAVDVNGEGTSGWNHEDESTDATAKGGLPRTSDEAE